MYLKQTMIIDREQSIQSFRLISNCPIFDNHQKLQQCSYHFICPLQQQLTMIKIKIKAANTIPETVNKLDREFGLDRRFLWIGRGEEIHQKENQHSYALNLGELSQSVSRVHACLIFSPIFRTLDCALPSYYKKLAPNWSSLPEHLLFLIWEFARPSRKIVLKDMHSKTGIYKKVNKTAIKLGTQIVLGDSRPLLFEHQEIYDSCYLMNLRVEDLKAMGYVVLNQMLNNQALSFWIVSFKQQRYILKNWPSKLFIGRSSNCHLSICEASISRRHATLQYSKGEWTISDGDGNNPSSNGVWQRTKKCEIDCRNNQTSNWTIKIADVLFILQVKQEYSNLNLTELWLTHKSNSSFSELLKQQNQGTFTTKESAQVL